MSTRRARPPSTSTFQANGARPRAYRVQMTPLTATAGTVLMHLHYLSLADARRRARKRRSAIERILRQPEEEDWIQRAKSRVNDIASKGVIELLSRWDLRLRASATSLHDG